MRVKKSRQYTQNTSKIGILAALLAPKIPIFEVVWVYIA
jgi:hypothetical protein